MMEKQAYSLDGSGTRDEKVIRFLGSLIESGGVDALILPFRVPSEDSFAWILFSDGQLLDEAVPFPPIMPVQGAKALRSLTRKEKGSLKVLALMRPCEVRAGIELSKLGQVNPENLILATWDCPGALPTGDYLTGTMESDKAFMSLNGEPSDLTRSICASCMDYASVDSDVHFGCFGLSDDTVLIFPRTSAGTALLEGRESGEVGDLPSLREAELKRIDAAREKAGLGLSDRMESDVKGFDGMLRFFSDCIACHNCQSACPICYCRMCYFDSEVSRSDPEAYLNAAVKRGGISLPPDRLMFHTGRMAHMSLSCVSCGQCSDVCPADIPVADVFSFVANESQKAFEYRAGARDGEPLPLRQFRDTELPGVHEMVREADTEVHQNKSAETDRETESHE
jgi:formate dehydrogenase (coenzyme F420) beta subunit